MSKTPKYIRYANAVYRLAEAYVIENAPGRMGKFDDAVGEWLYEKSLEGWSDESLGEADTFGHYDLLTFDTPVQVKDKTGDWTFLAAIVGEDSQGFVYYQSFDTVEKAKAKWAELEAEYEQFEAGVE